MDVLAEGALGGEDGAAEGGAVDGAAGVEGEAEEDGGVGDLVVDVFDGVEVGEVEFGDVAAKRVRVLSLRLDSWCLHTPTK